MARYLIQMNMLMTDRVCRYLRAKLCSCLSLLISSSALCLEHYAISGSTHALVRCICYWRGQGAEYDEHLALLYKLLLHHAWHRLSGASGLITYSVGDKNPLQGCFKGAQRPAS